MIPIQIRFKTLITKLFLFENSWIFRPPYLLPPINPYPLWLVIWLILPLISNLFHPCPILRQSILSILVLQHLYPLRSIPLSITRSRRLIPIKRRNLGSFVHPPLTMVRCISYRKIVSYFPVGILYRSLLSLQKDCILFPCRDFIQIVAFLTERLYPISL